MIVFVLPRPLILRRILIDLTLVPALIPVTQEQETNTNLNWIISDQASFH